MSDLEWNVLDEVDLTEEEREGFSFTPTWQVASSLEALQGVHAMYDYKKSRVLFAEVACGKQSAYLYAMEKPVLVKHYADLRDRTWNYRWHVNFKGNAFHASGETFMGGPARSPLEARRAAVLTTVALFRAFGVAAPVSLSEAEVRTQHRLLTVEKRQRRQGATMLRSFAKDAKTLQELRKTVVHFGTARDIG